MVVLILALAWPSLVEGRMVVLISTSMVASSTIPVLLDHAGVNVKHFLDKSDTCFALEESPVGLEDLEFFDLAVRQSHIVEQDCPVLRVFWVEEADLGDSIAWHDYDLLFINSFDYFLADFLCIFEGEAFPFDLVVLLELG